MGKKWSWSDLRSLFDQVILLQITFLQYSRSWSWSDLRSLFEQVILIWSQITFRVILQFFDQYWYYPMINNNLFLVDINLQMILPYVHHWQFAPSIVMSEKKLCSSSCLVFSCCDSKWQAFINRIWASYLNKYNMMIEWWYTSNVK